MMGAIQAANGANKPDRPRYWELCRARHLLTQEVFCGVCGGQMSNNGQGYLAYSKARKPGLCTNIPGILRHKFDALVVDALRSRMVTPEPVGEFIREFTTESNRAVAASRIDRDAVARDLAAVERKLVGLIDAISEGMQGGRAKAKMDALGEREGGADGQACGPCPAPPRLHPNLAEVYRAKVERLGEALQAGADSQALPSTPCAA